MMKKCQLYIFSLMLFTIQAYTDDSPSNPDPSSPSSDLTVSPPPLDINSPLPSATSSPSNISLDQNSARPISCLDSTDSCCQQKEGWCCWFDWCKDLKVDLFGGIGYRYDSQKISARPENDIIFGIDYRKRQTVQAVLGLELDYKNFLFELRGDYGWLASGKFDFFSGFKDYDLGSGYTADAQAAIGYRIQQYSCRDLIISFVPIVGYKYWHMNNWAKGEKRSTSFPATGGETVSFVVQETPDQQDWFGPYLEADLEFNYQEKWDLSLSYQYHFLHFRGKVTEHFNAVNFTIADGPRIATDVQLINNLTSNHAHANVGGIDLRYTSCSNWIFGGHFEGTWIKTNKVNLKQRSVIEEFSSPLINPAVDTFDTVVAHGKYKINWTIYSTYLYFGYEF